MSKRSRRAARHRRESKTIQQLVRFNEKRGMSADVTLEVYSAHKATPPAVAVFPPVYIRYLIELLIARINRELGSIL
jgi:hypothetical protein